MTILSRLLGKRTQRTELQTLIEELDFNKIPGVVKRIDDETQQAPTAISLALLVVVGKFCRGVREQHAQLNKTMGATNPIAPYDVIAYESAAFFHYSLMRDQLSYEALDEEGEKDDPYFDALRDALSVTSGFINDGVKFGVPSEMFRNRLMNYGVKRHTIEAELSEFESILSGSIKAGTPAGGLSGRINLEDLALALALKTQIPITYTTMIPALHETSRRLFEYEWA